MPSVFGASASRGVVSTNFVGSNTACFIPSSVSAALSVAIRASMSALLIKVTRATRAPSGLLEMSAFGQPQRWTLSLS